MTTFSVEINEDIVTRLKESDRPEVTLDLPSVPEPGDKLWVKSMRGTHIVETDRCMIVESHHVSRLRPTVRLVLLFGIAAHHGHAELADQEAIRERRRHAPLPEIIRNIRSEQERKELLQARHQMTRKVELLNKIGLVTSGDVGHTSTMVANDHAAAGDDDKNSGRSGEE